MNAVNTIKTTIPRKIERSMLKKNFLAVICLKRSWDPGKKLFFSLRTPPYIHKNVMLTTNIRKTTVP